MRETHPATGKIKIIFQSRRNISMAHRIRAVNAYCPRIELGNTVQKPELVRALSRATGLGEGMVDYSIKELRDQIMEFNRTGRPVKVDGLGIFTLTISLDGEFNIVYRSDPALHDGLNLPGIFSGTLINRENIGKSTDELVEQWNADHPDNAVAG
jgi:hypothetical protein